MDEPTNHLDIQSKEIIKLALQKFDGTLIVISHDREFLQGLSDKIFEFRNGKMKEFLGNIDEYLEYRQKESLREVSLEKAKLEQKHSQESKPEPEPEPQPQIQSKEQKNLLNKIKKAEEQIEDFEQKIADLEADFTKENPSPEKLANYENLKAELEKVMADWEALNLQLEG